MKVLDQLTNKKGLKSADLAERAARERDEAGARDAEIGALRLRAAALDEEIRVAVVAAALDGAQNDAAITKARAEHRAVVAQADVLRERNQTAALVIAELESRHHQALVAENTAARERLASEYADHAARTRALLLEAATHQERAMRVRFQEGELACAICVQHADGRAAESLIPQTPLGPDLANVAQAYEAVDSGNHELARLMRMG